MCKLTCLSGFVSGINRITLRCCCLFVFLNLAPGLCWLSLRHGVHSGIAWLAAVVWMCLCLNLYYLKVGKWLTVTSSVLMSTALCASKGWGYQWPHEKDLCPPNNFYKRKAQRTVQKVVRFRNCAGSNLIIFNVNLFKITHLNYILSDIETVHKLYQKVLFISIGVCVTFLDRLRIN